LGNTKIPKGCSTWQKTKPKTIDFLTKENISKLLAIIYGIYASCPNTKKIIINTKITWSDKCYYFLYFYLDVMRQA
jgi:hypothetical protein